LKIFKDEDREEGRQILRALIHMEHHRDPGTDHHDT
jgi:hypothetical protein